jgi:hypothetical protein
MMGYVNSVKKGIKQFILTTLIGLHGNNFMAKHALN